MENLFIYNFFYCLAEEDGRRPGQRPATSMLGNEVMSKEQLYDLYQQILGVKKFEHQLLYNAMQVTYVLLKVIYPKYSKHWLSTVAHTIDCVCVKYYICMVYIMGYHFHFSSFLGEKTF